MWQIAYKQAEFYSLFGLLEGFPDGISTSVLADGIDFADICVHLGTIKLMPSQRIEENILTHGTR